MLSFFHWKKNLLTRPSGAAKDSPPRASAQPLSAFLPPADRQKSPLSGMTREHWKASARLLLEGVFSHLRDDGRPMELPRTEFRVTYPHRNDGPRAGRAASFEALVRTFLTASVLLREEPELKLNGICAGSYYRKQLVLAASPDGYAGTYESYSKESPWPILQQTVECGLLVIGLQSAGSTFWNAFSRSEQDLLLDFLAGYARGNLPLQNWMLFSLLIFAFLEQHGRPADRQLVHSYARRVTALYAGDGWYRDGTDYDYYSCWAFQTFGPLWCVWYGDCYEPEAAEVIRSASAALMEHYPALFGADGSMLFYGRSALYRCAHLGALFGSICLQDSHLSEADAGSIPSPGAMRALASRALLSFLEKPELLTDGILSPGLFGPFPPVLQTYSCNASAYWMGLAFLFLTLPEEHPFWNAEEEPFSPPRGSSLQEYSLPAPGMALTVHPENGASILRPGKVLTADGNWQEAALRAKLSYHSAWPPEMDSAGSAAACQAASAQPLLVFPDGKCCTSNALFYSGIEDSVLYRRAFFGFYPGAQWHWLDSLFLADFPVPLGLLQICRADLVPRPVTLTLGSWGFPADGAIVSELRSPEGIPAARAVCLRRDLPDGRSLQMAMTIWDGWEGLQVKERSGVNPLWDSTLLMAASRTFSGDRRCLSPLLVSQLLSKDSPEPFTEAELFPLISLTETGSGMLLHFRSGQVRKIDYSQKEGRMEL